MGGLGLRRSRHRHFTATWAGEQYYKAIYDYRYLAYAIG